MPEYLSPGVYVEEISTGVKPIEGVSTSTAGMVGATELGPVDGLPRLVTSFLDFQRLYGGFLSETPWGDTRFLAYAVQGFFQNGGQRAYIQRVVGDNALSASRDLEDGVDHNGTDFLITRLAEDMQEAQDEAVLVSSRGVQIGTELTFVQTAGGVEDSETATVSLIKGNKVSLSGPTQSRYTRSAVVLIAAPPSYARASTLSLEAANPGEWGSRVRVESSPSSRTSTRLVSVDLQTTLLAQPVTLNLSQAVVAGASEAEFTPGQAVMLRIDDSLRFDDGAGTIEERTVKNITGDTVEFTETLAAYPDTATVTLLTPVALRVDLPTNDVTVKPASTAGLLSADRVVIEDGGGNLVGTIKTVVPSVSLTITLDDQFPIDRTLLEGAKLRLLSAGRDTDTVGIAGARNLYAGGAVELENANAERLYATVLAINGDQVQLSQNIPGNYLGGDAVRTLEFDLRIQLTRINQVTGREEIVREEIHKLLSLAPDAPNNAVTRINEDSKLVNANDPGSTNDSPFNFPTTIDPEAFTSFLYLQNGADGDPPKASHYRGTDGGPGARTGIMALEDIDIVSIIAAPGIVDPSVQGALIEQCERLMDRFAVLDGPVGADIQEIQNRRAEYDTRYAALYHPWVTVRDPLDDLERNVPPSGHIIGIYARTDNERGVHKAPANEVIRGIVKLEQVLNKREQDVLNPHPVNINVLRDFRERGRGLRVWGARCVTSDTEWKYVNVRRLFIFIEESIEEGTQWVVFEPNDEPLWARVRQSVINFLTTVWRDGALMGRTAEEAFFVKCDRTTMTQDDIDNGRLIMIVGCAPVKPAEFVIIRIGQYTGGSEVQEQ